MESFALAHWRTSHLAEITILARSRSARIVPTVFACEIRYYVASTMARTGRTAGSKNRPGHGAGGARAGSGRPSKEVAAQREEERQQKAAQEAARKAAEREKRQKQQERERKQRQVRIERIQKQAMSQIRRSARLQQQHDNDVLCRQGEYGDDVVDDNNEDDSDPGDDELEDMKTTMTNLMTKTIMEQKRAATMRPKSVALGAPTNTCRLQVLLLGWNWKSSRV